MAIPRKVKAGDPITADYINSIVDSIKECQINAFVGGSFKRGTDGTTLTISPSKKSQAATAEACPFDVTGSISGTSLVLSVAAGMVNGVIPSNIFNTLTTTTSGVKYVVVNCETDGKNVVAASCAVVTSLPVPQASTLNVAPPTFGVMIAAITGTEIAKTIACGNVTARVSPTVQVDSVTYTAGNRNYSQFFSWLY